MENAYPELIQAARSLPDLGGLDVDDEGQLSDDRIAAFLQASQAGLRDAHHALASRCWVPVEYTWDFYAKHAGDLPSIRNLAHAFVFEATSAERGKKFAEAVQTGLSILDLANAVRRGGLMTDLLVAAAVERIGINRLRRLRRALTSDQCTSFSAELMRVDDEREPFDEIAARDSEWEEKVGPGDQGANGAEPLVPTNSVEGDIFPVIQALADLPEEEQRNLQRQIDDRGAALLRLLAVESALRAYHCVSGRYPDELRELVPDFVTKVPPDPFGDQAFRYRTEDGGFVLYSVGPSGTDAGGRFGSWREALCGDADLCLDVFDFQEG